MRHIYDDLRYAVRGLRKTPLFTVVAVASMAFGIASNTAVFTLVDQVMLRKLPVNRPDALVQLSAAHTESYGGTLGDGSELSYAMYRDLRDHNRVFSGMFCRMATSLHVGYEGRTEQVAGELVSGTFFTELGVTPTLGRLFTPADERSPGGHPIAVLGYDYWKARFNGDTGVVGQRIIVNGHPLEIVGVVGATFAGVNIAAPTQVYVPIVMQPQMGPSWLQLEGRRFRWVQVFGRLRDGVTLEGAHAALQPLYRSILEREAADDAFARASDQTRREFLDGKLAVLDASRGRSGLHEESNTQPLIILMAIAGGVLLIVCANVANLLIARGAARQREFALRVAVGAGKKQVIRLLLVESVLLGTMGAVAGLVLAVWGASILLDFFRSPEQAFAVRAEPDGRILLFTAAVAMITAVLAGIVPAVRSTRVDIASTLKASGSTVVSEHPRLRKTLVVAQVALSFVLLIGAGLFLRSLKNLLDLDPGFRTSRVVSFGFDLSRAGYDAARAGEFSKMVLERISRVPGVSAAAFSFQSLLGGGGWGMGFTVEGYQPPQGESAGAMVNGVSPGFFRAMGMTLLAGREFTGRDDRGTALKEGWPYTVAVVNQTFANRYFKGANPIGRRIGVGTDPGTQTPIEVVGLVKDARYTAIREDAMPQVFLPYLQATMEGVTMYVRTEQHPSDTMQSLRRLMASLDPQLAIYDVATLEERVDRSLVNERLVASLSATLSAMATLLSVIGLYGVMAYLVTRRTREFGIRMALGALTSQIARGVLREASVLVLAGLSLGVVGAWWLGRYVRSQLYGVQPADPVTVATAAAVLAAVAYLAASLPARRAARVSPVAALRDE